MIPNISYPREVDWPMPFVELKHKHESFDSLLRRWKRAVERSDILKTLRKYEAFERPGDKRKRAKAAAVKRQERLTQENEWLRLGIKPPVKKLDDKRKKQWGGNNEGDRQDNGWR